MDGRYTRRTPLGINYANANWTLYPEDEPHNRRIRAQMMGLRRFDEVLPGVPEFVGRLMDTNHHHVTRTHLQPFLKFKWGHTYRINISRNSQYVRGMQPIPPVLYIHATFLHYVYRNVPHVKMLVLETNLPIRVNEIYVFDVRDFTNSNLLRDLTTPASLAQFTQERSNSSGIVNKIVMDAIDRQRTLDGTPFTFPRYQHHLGRFGGKKSKRKTRKH